MPENYSYPLTINAALPNDPNISATIIDAISSLNLSQMETENLSDFLFSTDFFDAPASTRYHLCCPHGLACHTLNVMHAIFPIAFQFGVNTERAVLAALLHDLCKCDFYEEFTTNFKDRDRSRFGKNRVYTDAQGDFVWSQKRAYKVNEAFHYGHGEKSALIATTFLNLDLTPFECQAIRYHMGDFVNNPETSQVYANNKLALALHMADLYASASLDLSAEECEKYNILL